MKPKMFAMIVLALMLNVSTCFAERVSVSVRSANVRVGPGTKFDIAWESLDRYYPLEIINKSDSWYYVRDYENDKGWISKTVVNNVKSVITRRDKCNVRSGPGTKYKVVFVVDNGVPFKILKRQGSWIRVQHSDGDRGWIHKKLVW